MIFHKCKFTEPSPHSYFRIFPSLPNESSSLFAAKTLSYFQPQATANPFTLSTDLLFWMLHINSILLKEIFCVQLFSLSMFLRFIHISTCVQNIFLSISSIPLYGYITFWLSNWAYRVFSPKNMVIVNYAYIDNQSYTFL